MILPSKKLRDIEIARKLAELMSPLFWNKRKKGISMIQAGLESVSYGFVGKLFDRKLYDENTIKAYEGAIQHFKHFYIELKPEDYNIDCNAYLTKEDFINKRNPIFKLELELRTHFDEEIKYNGFTFFGRKQKMLSQEVTPFWLVYNPQRTNCLLVPFPALMRGRLKLEAMNKKKENQYDEEKVEYDMIYKVPKVFGNIGIENLDRAILEYFISVANPMYQAIFGSDYQAFDIDHLKIEDVRQLAKIANTAYRNVFTIKDNPPLEWD